MSKIDEFLQIVDDIYGLYLDTVESISFFRKKFIELQNNSFNLSKNILELDSKKFIFGKGRPSKGKELHRCTQGEFKERTQKMVRTTI